MEENAVEELVELLHTLAAALVEDADTIEIEPEVEGNSVVLELRVSEDDMGRVIGKGGRRAQAIRTIMKARASRLNCRVAVNIVD